MCSANFSDSFKVFLANVTAFTEPRSFKDAMEFDVWRKAMGFEITALEDSGTWDLVDLPPGKRAIGCKWVFKLKFNSDGTVERHKARLVALGNRQEEGVDYDETFAPVIKMTTVRTFLNVAASRNWALHQMDVHNAFLHGTLDEEVYMKPPPGFLSSGSTKVCRLKKSLYGLKQVPRCWFGTLQTALLDYGFRQSTSDYSLFSLVRGDSEIYVLVYVDDLLFGGNDTALLSAFKSYLSSQFHMKDLGTPRYFLGIEMARNAEGFFLCQRKYCLDIISEAGLLGCRPTDIPLAPNHRLAHSVDAPYDNPYQYRRIVGKLIYLTLTHPELSYSVHILSQFMQKPTVAHWNAALKVLRYLKGTPGQGILYKAGTDLVLTGYCDADYNACPLTRRSLTGFVFFLDGSPISWKTKKQDTVSLSTAEVEYRSMSWTHKLWFQFYFSRCVEYKIMDYVSLRVETDLLIDTNLANACVITYISP
ncbi:unnamed protein product [Microthlaspi erraticum]|uniref:Reverse transcriptase Ty1/copia-type domain-containing protein n=1 Tax=Microthlaspi erraticum TaxID=1685480 RepID=A0A6D2LE59_9BRAS|nr:unnamed protein product [Microthlaspi erraticum]